VQVALLKTHTRLYQYQGEAEFSTWLLRIVPNECFRLLSERRRALFDYLDDTPDDVPFELSARDPDAEYEVASGQLKQILATEVRRVPPLLRNVITPHDIQELPIKAVADTLEISIPAAKTRLVAPAPSCDGDCGALGFCRRYQVAHAIKTARAMEIS
jgi:RNA polymerase sigma-70 factor, ECF subfamily